MKKTGTMLASLLALGLTTSVIKDERSLGGNDPDVPHYLLPSEYCARYARLAAKDLSGTEYIGANAWDLADANKLAANVNGNLEELLDTGTLIPRSSIVTFYNLKEGKIRHAALYMGKNEKGQHFFAHQYKDIQLDETEEQLKERGYEPRQVIAPRGK